MLTAAFWRGAAERALKTFAQSLAAVIGVGALGVLDIDWVSALSVAALATVGSLLTSIGNAGFTAGATPPAVEQPRVETQVNIGTAERTVDLTPPGGHA